jgi:hypothetical protein
MRSLRTFDSWRTLLEPTPHKIEFPKMELLGGRDHEPPVLIGRGELDGRAVADPLGLTEVPVALT